MSSLLPRPNQRRAKAKRLSREGQEGRGGSGSTRGRGPWMSPPCPGVLTGIFPSGTSEGNPVPEEGVCVPAPWQKAALAAPAVYPQCAEVRGSLAAGAAGSDPAAAGERSQRLRLAPLCPTCHSWWRGLGQDDGAEGEDDLPEAPGGGARPPSYGSYYRPGGEERPCGGWRA